MTTGKQGEVRIYVRVPKSIKNKVTKKAKQANISFAGYVRQILQASLIK